MDSQTPTLQFGVELELLLGGRKKTFSSWSSLAKDVSKRLAKAGIPNHVNEGGSKSAETYQEWSVVPEVTIPSQPAKNLWGLELVSPVYPAGWYWAADLDTIFATIHGAYAVAPSSHCSTHVHVSRTPVALGPAELALLAKAALYFEPALDALAPTGRQGSSTYWCQSNRASTALQGYGLDGCFQVLDSAALVHDGPRAVVEAINLFPATSAYGRAHGKKHDFVRGKAFKWDFAGMLAKSSTTGGTGLGTVEYRQAPGSLGAEQAGAWVSLAVAFVAGIVGVGDFAVADPHNGGTLAELWNVLQNGAALLGWESLGALEELFAAGSSDSDN